MTEIIIAIIGAALGIFGIIWGAKSSQRAKSLKQENDSIAQKYVTQIDKENQTVEEIKDVKKQMAEIASTRQSAASLLDRLRNNKK